MPFSRRANRLACGRKLTYGRNRRRYNINETLRIGGEENGSVLRCTRTPQRHGTHLFRRANAWWFKFDPNETKYHRLIDVPFPELLVPHLALYVEHYRPLLAGNRCTGDRLWVSYLYRPQAAYSLQLRLVNRTQKAFGRPINPHLFRDIIATSIAVHDPHHVRIAAANLGHNSFATPERHYNLARSLEARDKLRVTIVTPGCVRTDFIDAVPDAALRADLAAARTRWPFRRTRSRERSRSPSACSLICSGHQVL